MCYQYKNFKPQKSSHKNGAVSLARKLAPCYLGREKEKYGAQRAKELQRNVWWDILGKKTCISFGSINFLFGNVFTDLMLY